MKNQTILITGGSGFIGTHLAKSLANNNTVIVIDLQPGQLENVNYLTCPYNDLDVLNTILPQVDLVYHLAWSSTPALSLTIQQEYQQNIKPSQDLIGLSQRHKVGRFVFMSSAGAIYGSITPPFKESDTPKPINSYGQAKLEVEKILKNESAPQFKATCIRATNVVGPDQVFRKQQGVIPAIKKALTNNQVFQLWGNARKDYLHIDDLISGLIAVTNQQEPFEIFNLGSGQLLAVTDIITTLEKKYHKKLRLKKLAARPHDIQKLEVDISQAKQILGWKPKHQLDFLK